MVPKIQQWTIQSPDVIIWKMLRIHWMGRVEIMNENDVLKRLWSENLNGKKCRISQVNMCGWNCKLSAEAGIKGL